MKITGTLPAWATPEALEAVRLSLWEEFAFIECFVVNGRLKICAAAYGHHWSEWADNSEQLATVATRFLEWKNGKPRRKPKA